MSNLELIGVPYFKKGSKIHIKKKNRGKFTDYCGGKVTQACIDKAKKSKNPKLRKRATFAENSRTWKHQEGGTIINDDKYTAWVTNWLNNRQSQFTNNVNDYKEFELGFNGDSRDYNIMKLISPSSKDPQKELNRQLSNMQNTTSIYGDPGEGAAGRYRPLFKKIIYSPNSDEYTRIHERTHSLIPNPQAQKIKQIIKEGKGMGAGYYFSRPHEIYSRMMELRYKTGLTPDTKINQDWINKNRDSIKQFDLNIMHDDDLMRMLNEVASTNKKVNTDNIA